MHRGEPPELLALKCPLAVPRSVPSLRSGRQELEAMVPLEHPHLIRPWGIVHLHAQNGFGSSHAAESSPRAEPVEPTTGGTGLVLDAFPAGSLAQLLRAGPTLWPGELVTALSPVASALEHLHSHGAAHGDVTAANILLSTDGRPVLSDLGDAGVLGFPSERATAADDVYALAVIAWQALSGTQPGPSSQRVPLAALRPEIPHSLVDLLEESLNDDPAQRPSAEEFGADLFDAVEATALNLVPHVDDDALAEMPTVLPTAQQKSKTAQVWSRLRRWWGLTRR